MIRELWGLAEVFASFIYGTPLPASHIFVITANAKRWKREIVL